jgi:hypothetical protein
MFGSSVMVSWSWTGPFGSGADLGAEPGDLGGGAARCRLKCGPSITSNLFDLGRAPEERSR